MPRRPFIPLSGKMQESGYSLNRISSEINSHFALNVTRFDISNFIHKNFCRINSKKRKFIRYYFIAHGWLPKPKHKYIPVCKRCGEQFPLGKSRSASNTIRKIQTLIRISNHKRTTKLSQ